MVYQLESTNECNKLDIELELEREREIEYDVNLNAIVWLEMSSMSTNECIRRELERDHITHNILEEYDRIENAKKEALSVNT